MVASGLLALTWAQFAFVHPTNFGGTDEWLNVSLTSQGIVGAPFSNRPFVLIWTVPGALALPHTLRGYFLVYVTYLWLTGCTCYALLRRFASAPFAALAGAFAIAWAPRDWLRLNAIGTQGYAGFTLFTFLTVLALLESYRRRSLPLFALAAALGFVNVRGFEAVLPLLAAAPLLLFAAGGPRRRLLTWSLGWECALAVPAFLVIAAILRPGEGGLYQTTALGLDLQPLHVLRRLARLFGFHLLPLFTTPPRELLVVAVPLAVAAVLAMLLAMARLGGGTEASDESPGALAGFVAFGFLAATVGFLPFALSSALSTPERTQFLSGPGIALFLASLVQLGAHGVPRRFRWAAAPLLGLWIVAVGTGRVVAMQAEWRDRDAFPAQRQTLLALSRAAPDLQPHTVVVLLDEPQVWIATFTFRHAVSYIYGRRAVGHVWGAHEMLYPARFDAAAIHVLPWKSLWETWHELPESYGYDEVVCIRLDSSLGVTVLDRWPDELPPLPSGARYDPRKRIMTEAPPRPEAAVLEP